MTAGPAPETRRSSLALGVGSLVAGFLSVAALLGLLVLGASGEGKGSEGLAGILFLGALGGSVAGLAMGLVAREHARRTGSPLAIIGCIANALILGLLAVLTVVGLLRK